LIVFGHLVLWAWRDRPAHGGLFPAHRDEICDRRPLEIAVTMIAHWARRSFLIDHVALYSQRPVTAASPLVRLHNFLRLLADLHGWTMTGTMRSLFYNLRFRVVR